MDRDFMRQNLQHYQGLLTHGIGLQAKRELTAGYTPLSGALSAVVKWLKADRAGDYETASPDAWFDASDLAAKTWAEWGETYSGNFIRPRDELDGLSIAEFYTLIVEAQDTIYAQLVGELELAR